MTSAFGGIERSTVSLILSHMTELSIPRPLSRVGERAMEREIEREIERERDGERDSPTCLSVCLSLLQRGVVGCYWERFAVLVMGLTRLFYSQLIKRKPMLM